jgi:glycosyltransferase involved in cell wall biosynthesis
MSDLPLISIVTPTLNQAGFIENTIDSVLNQGYPKLEYLVIDGGSVDGTHEILKSYEGHLSWWIEPDIGQSGAINQGWKNAGGEILAWINSDDFYFSDTLNRVGNYFLQHDNVDMLYGKCDYVDLGGRFLRPYPTQKFNYEALLIKTNNYIPQPAVFFRRRILDEVGYLDEALDYVMDFEFWLRIGRFCNVIHIPDCLAAMRLHPEAKSISKLDKFGSELVEVYESYFLEKDLHPVLRNLESEAMANIYHRAADCAFWGKSYSMARRFTWESRKFRSWPPRGLWLWVALGKIGGIVAKKFYKNPYFP